MERDQFSFLGAAGDVVTFTLVETGDLDPGFIAVGLVLRPDGFPAGTFIQTSVNAMSLPATGTYTVVIHDVLDTNRGSYALRMGWALPLSKQCGDRTALTCGQVAIGAIDVPLELDLFTFFGEQGSIATLPLLETGAIDQGFIASGLLLRPDGFPVGTFGANFTASFTLPATGTYVLIVRDVFESLRGRYSLRLESAASCPSAPPFLGVAPNRATYPAGSTLFLTTLLRAGGIPQPVDAYIVVQLPSGQFLSLQFGGRLVPGIVPLARGFVPFNTISQYQNLLISYTFNGSEPAGTYLWSAVLTRPGTLDFVSALHQSAFTVP
jgi:hypothetical protein